MTDVTKQERTDGSWSMSEERAFMENLLCSRFNFFLIFFSLILAGGVATHDATHFRILFSIGFVLSLLLAFTIFRAQAKLDRALRDHLFATDGHPARVLNEGMERWSTRKLIGYVIPGLCVLILLAGALLGTPASQPVPAASDPISGQAQGAAADRSYLPDLLGGIAALLWPVLLAAALWYFRKEIRSVLSRLKRGKILGQEIELGESLSALDKDAREVESATPIQGAAWPNVEDESVAARVLAEAGRSPKVALMLLAAELEREVRSLLASLGWLDEVGARSLRMTLDEMVRREMLRGPLRGSIRHFADARNRIVHGHAATDNDALRALDSGLTILRAVMAIPHEVNVVYHPGVEVYEDAAGRIVREGVRAVVLETTSSEGTSKTLRIFPTRHDDYKKGQRVSWEWNSDFVTGESWYLDPDTGSILYGWSQSMEFAGRAIE